MDSGGLERSGRAFFYKLHHTKHKKKKRERKTLKNNGHRYYKNRVKGSGHQLYCPCQGPSRIEGFSDPRQESLNNNSKYKRSIIIFRNMQRL